MAVWTQQLYYEDVQEGDDISPLTFNLTVQRMVMAAGSNRDFGNVHHNTRMAQAWGAPDMFLNNVSCLGMWERVISDWIGIYGRVKKTSFRMTTFNVAGDSVVVKGKVAKKWREEGQNLVQLDMTSENSRGTSMQGFVVVSLPSRS